MAGQVDDFKYFSYLIIFVLLIYIFILSIFLCVRRNEIRKERDLGLLPYNEAINDEYCAAYRINLTTKFEQIVMCSLGSSLSHRIVLMCVRLVLFLYFFIVGSVLNGVEKSYAFDYFENWCALLVMLYFLLATICSIISIHTERSRTDVERRLNAVSAWTLKVRVLGVCTHLIFEVAGGTSMFVLVMVHFIHGPASELINTVHIMSFVALLVEMWLNTVRVRFDQYPACAAWLVFYLLVIWPCVFTGVFLTWPYPEMTTKDILCFRNYFVVFLLNFVFYACWYVLYKIKKLTFVCKDRYLDNRSSAASSVGDDSSSVASSARGGGSSMYSSSWFDTGDDWHYPMATATATNASGGGGVGAIGSRSLNLQPMGYRSSGGDRGDGNPANSTSGTGNYHDSGRPPTHSGGVNRTLNLQQLGSRQTSSGSTDYYGGGDYGNDYYSANPAPAPATAAAAGASTSGGGGHFSYWNSGGPVRPPVHHNRTLNLNPISTYHRGGGSVSDHNSSDNSMSYFGAASAGESFYEQQPPPPPHAAAGHQDDYYSGAGSGGYGAPVQRTGTYASPPAPPSYEDTRNGGGSHGYGYSSSNSAHAHNRTVNINPISSYHRGGAGSGNGNAYSEPPPPAPAPAAAGSTWRGYAIGGNRGGASNTTSSASSGIRFPGYSSNKPHTVDRTLNLNPINRYHQSNTNPNNMSRQFSNTDNDLNQFANFGDDGNYE